MTRWLTLAVTAGVVTGVAVFALGPQALGDALLSRTLRNQAKMESYRGVLVERGLISEGELRSEIHFARPDRVKIVATSPDPWTGSTFLSSAGTATLYWPQLNYAIRVDHLPQVDPAGIRQLAADAYRHGAAAYQADLSGTGQVAGHPTVQLAYTARKAGTAAQKMSLEVYDKYSIPLSGEMHFANAIDYAFHFESIDFNPPLDETAFKLDLPPATLITHWDLQGAAIPLAGARAGANFALSLPAETTGGLRQSRIVRVDGTVPAYAALYRTDPYYLVLTEYKDTGLKLAEMGLPMAAGKHQGKLLLAPLSTTYTFHEGGVVYQLFGNVPYEDVLAFAASL